MMKLLRRCLVSVGMVFAMMAGLSALPAKAAPLPTCTPGVNCLQFGDFNVFSLPLLELQRTAGASSVPSPGSPNYYAAGYGQIQNYTIIGINNGQCTSTGNPAGSDCSYNTPSANNINTFSTITTADPGGAGEFIGDQATSWDIRLSTLQSLVNAPPAPVVALFAFNETGSGSGLSDTSLLTWAKVTLSNDNGTSTADFYLRTGPATYTPSLANAGCATGTANCLPDPASDPNSVAGQMALAPWVYVHAGICTDGLNFVGFPDANGSCTYISPTATVRNQNNLGQNAASFMVNSPALDAAIASGLYTVMNVTWQLSYINGGGETAWIQPFDAPTRVPEPSTLASLGLGLLGLAFLMRRRPR